MPPCAPAGDIPKTDMSPDGLTEPPAAIATTAAVIGPNEPAVSAPSRCSPSAATPAIARNAQLTAATAESTTLPHLSREPPYPPIPPPECNAPKLSEPPETSLPPTRPPVPAKSLE
ncbi:hypothetical protein GCM10012280_04680 [Wenjunlia tyrosinilytica]|uniref:Uncharacterized protein n=1 Tax=Wenjunlia tyrosinilytica TaxID=1544741 RepID=A0A917ZFH8_9ACTN|nr:hypothetical protein GCM10012280_04680 [Wenjunlia tyrosinilytica]